jgi:hypothetical protein
MPSLTGETHVGEVGVIAYAAHMGHPRWLPPSTRDHRSVERTSLIDKSGTVARLLLGHRPWLKPAEVPVFRLAAIG